MVTQYSIKLASFFLPGAAVVVVEVVVVVLVSTGGQTAGTQNKTSGSKKAMLQKEYLIGCNGLCPTQTRRCKFFILLAAEWLIDFLVSTTKHDFFHIN